MFDDLYKLDSYAHHLESLYALLWLKYTQNTQLKLHK